MTRSAILYVARRNLVPDTAFHHAMRLAVATGVPLTVLHVHREGGEGTHDPLALGRLVTEAEGRGIEVDTVVLGRSGSWIGQLGRLDWSRWTLALKVAEPEGAVRTRMGLTLDQRLARAPLVPVWFVPPSLGAALRVVMAAVDVTLPDRRELTETVLRLAGTVAEAEGARLYAAHAWSLADDSILTSTLRGLGRARADRAARGIRRARRRTLEALAAWSGRAAPLMLRGRPEKALRRGIRNVGADLLVLGTVARDGVEGALMGNLAERFVGRAGPGILVAKPGGPIPALTRTSAAA